MGIMNIKNLWRPKKYGVIFIGKTTPISDFFSGTIYRQVSFSYPQTYLSGITLYAVVTDAMMKCRKPHFLHPAGFQKVILTYKLL